MEKWTESGPEVAMKLNLLLTLLMSVLLAGCGYGNSGSMMGGSGPMISQVMPSNAMAGGGDFILTINGSGFASNSVVYWNSTPHSTSYVTGNQLTAVVMASDIANSGTVPVYVRSNNQNSNTINFTIN